MCARRRPGLVSSACAVVWIEQTAMVEVQYKEMMQGRLSDAVMRAVSAAR